MPEYVSIPTITDPDALAQDAFDYLETKVPTWEPHDAQLDTWMIAAVARLIATLLDTMTDVEIRIFRYLGANVFQIPPVESTAATAVTKWTMSDTAGHTIPAGTAIAIPTTGGEQIAFETKEDVVIPEGSETAIVPVVAIEPGSESNGIGKAAGELKLLDQLSFVNTVILEAPTAGGQDAEEDSDYLNRLVGELRLLAPRPITIKDFSELARTVPGVHRAVAINGYNPADGTFNNERMVAVACVDENGVECSAQILKEVEELLLSKREVNFIINMIPVTTTEVSVEFSVKKWAEWNSEDVLARCITALEEFLSPKEWGQPPFGDRTVWYVRETVKLTDIIAVLGKVQGVEDVLTVKLKKAAGAFEEKDIALAGVAALPKPGTFTGTVS